MAANPAAFDRLSLTGEKSSRETAARGISLLFASGDSGANCDGKKYRPNWPAASPYVTSVGGTAGSAPEAAAGLSSGGFSDRYPTPTWQKAAVAKYLESRAGAVLRAAGAE